jgi:hypothetical protein
MLAAKIMDETYASAAGTTRPKAQERAANNRPWWLLISYTGNLQRIGNDMLGARAAWDKMDDLATAARTRAFQQTSPLGTSRSPAIAEQRLGLADYFLDVDYPWYWSGAVIAALFVLSIIILCFRVRTLDTLK